MGNLGGDPESSSAAEDYEDDGFEDNEESKTVKDMLRDIDEPDDFELDSYVKYLSQ